MNPTIIVIAVIVILVLWLVGIFNQLVRLRNRFQNAFAQIDVQLKRRYDLIPNIVETAKGYMLLSMLGIRLRVLANWQRIIRATQRP